MASEQASGSPFCILSSKTMFESSLHGSLKNLFTKPGDMQEATIDGYKIDVLSSSTLIEIQTSNFSSIKPKLKQLLDRYNVLLVHPIAYEKWIVTYPSVGNIPLRERRSPRIGRVEDIFLELIYLSDILTNPKLKVEVVLVREKEIRRSDGRGSWRRRGISIIDHQLIEVIGGFRFDGLDDWRNLIPMDLQMPFTTNELGKKLDMNIKLARKMAFCLRSLDIIRVVGKSSRRFLYDLTPKVYNS